MNSGNSGGSSMWKKVRGAVRQADQGDGAGVVAQGRAAAVIATVRGAARGVVTIEGQILSRSRQ